MRTLFIIIVMLIQMGVTKFAHGEEVACTKDNYFVEVEIKHLQYDKNDKPYYDRVYRPFPGEWSLAFPGLGKLRVKAASKMPLAEEIKLEYQSLKGELLATKELKLFSSLTTHADLDVEFKKFFEKAKEGKVRLSIVTKKKSMCSLSISILGILEQDD